MAFQTNVFRGGEWVTETVDLRAVLKSQAPAKGPTEQNPLKAPRCGLLTSTVVESALVNSVLPVRLRSSQNNDVAFVGDHFVQICELRKDGRLEKIVRKNDFGSRIRNACVVGSAIIPDLKDDGGPEASSPPVVKTEESDPRPFSLSMSNPSSSSTELPPQLLMVVLENGYNVFLFIRPGPDGRPEFVASRFFVDPRHGNGYLGFRLAIDPSSRYVALAAATDCFVIYELESTEQLNQKYIRNEPLHPVRSSHLRSVRGVIHKIAFLHPRPGDDHHIILLLIVVRHGKSKMVIYEWELGDDLKTVFAQEKQGHRMPIEHRMPLLLIPLTVRSAFIAISADQIAVCTECLHGPPKFETVPFATEPTTANYRGRANPLWVAWARPFRLEPYYKGRDCIYLAREDGVVIFVQVDQESAVTGSTLIGNFPCSVSSAFACVYGECTTTDVIVLCSDSGPGGYWKVPPRVSIELLGTLPNWSPVVDFTTTDEFSGWDQGVSEDRVMVPWQQGKLRKPDRVFATCGSGKKGSVTEYRYGLKASIGLVLEYGAGIKQAWLLSSTTSPSSDSYLLLLSMPDCSAVLQLPPDFSSAREPAADTIPYDLSSTTLALAYDGSSGVQITKQNIVLVTEDRSVRIPCQELQGLSNASVSDACVLDGCLAISAHTDAQFRIHIFKVGAADLTLAHVQSIDVDGEVTCLSLGTAYSVLAGVRNGSQTFLAYGSIQQTRDSLEMIDLTEYLADRDENVGFDAPSLAEGIASIVSIGDMILLGTRSGEVITVKGTGGSVAIDCEKFGMTTANISCGYRAGANDPTILVSCDNTLVSIAAGQDGSCGGDMAHLKTKLRVWPMDASKPEAPPPPVHYATAVDMPSGDGSTPILMVSGSGLLLAELHHEPGPAHRSIPVDGEPTRIIYCQFTQCLVVAVNRDDRPFLMFVNPDTGEDIGRPTDKNDDPGLGKPGDRILGLTEWNYRRDGNVWNFILVSTRHGRLILISTQKSPREGAPPLIRYWTRFKKEVKEPIYSVIGYEEGLIYCYGQTIQWEVLDVTERKLKPFKSFQLNSPATSLRISNGKLVALTSRDSLVVLDHLDGDKDNTKLCHVDPLRRNAIHFIETAGPQPEEPLGGVILVSDRDCGVVGLWVPWQTPEKECEVVLEAELGASIRRFRRGRTRPLWEQRRHGPRYGRLASTLDDAEILGVSLNGAMHHFTLLDTEAWRLLRFLQNLALAGEEVCPFATREQQRDEGDNDGEDDAEPRMDSGLQMHVDGDILRRCLEKRALERLVVQPEHVSRLTELLRELDGGRHTAGFEAERDRGRYFRLAYDVLEYYLQPVL
ncbi:hypothetical protein VTK56DRAFT_6358 [Thermocarpiscus australiensis]